MTDPTITIAGLEARINSLLSAVQHSNRTTAERVTMFVEASSNADRLTAERDALAAQLAETRAALDAANLLHQQAVTAYEGERHHVETYRTRLAGIEESQRAKDEAHRAEVANLNGIIEFRQEERARVMTVLGKPGVAGTDAMEGAARAVVAERDALTARVSELEARPVLTVERLEDAMQRAGAAFIGGIGESRAESCRRVAVSTAVQLGPVTLPAQDRAEELVSAWRGICTDSATCDLDPAERMRRALASLGAPPTSPAAAIDADALYARCENDFMGGYTGQLYDAFKHGMWTVCNVLRSTKPTSPPAARPVFAGVSVEELVVQYLMAVDPGLDPGVARSMVSGPRRAGVAAVLARLKVSLVAPADPEEVARDFYIRLSKLTGSLQLSAHTDGDRRDRIETMRATLIARGIPVTPEVGK